MSERRYTEQHEWVLVDGNIATVGISEHAQEQLGDVVFIELPDVDQVIARNGPMAVVESVKAASDVYAPIGGTVIEVNDKLNDDPALVNRSAEGEGWFCKLEMAEPGQVDALMTADAYRSFVESNS